MIITKDTYVPTDRERLAEYLRRAVFVEEVPEHNIFAYANVRQWNWPKSQFEERPA